VLIGSQLGKGPIESGMLSDGSDTIPGHVPVPLSARDSVEKLVEIGPMSRKAKRRMNIEHLLQAAWTPAPPVPKGEETEPSVHTTTSVVGNLLRKSATASDQLGLERWQPSMKVITVKFGGPRGSG